MHSSTLDDAARARLDLLEAGHLKRSLRTTARGPSSVVARGGKEYVSFSCNDYLGLSRHPEVLEAARQALDAHGAGAGASRLISGNHALYAELEALLAEMKYTESALVFGSGYLANIATIPALVDGNDLILADKLIHACMLDGARLSGATLMRFAHNSAEHCAMLLADHRAEYRHCLILTETVFSMDGDRAPVSALAALAERHSAWLMTDDAHGLGVGESEGHAHVRMGTLSKAAGSYGGYVCAAKPVIELLATQARGFMFSTALPPAVVAASLAALKVMQRDADLCEKPLHNARLFTSALGLKEAQSAIVPVVLGEAERALAASAMLEENGFYVAAIRPPTVPPAQSRLRFAFSALHTEPQILRAAELLKRHGFA